MRLTDAAPDAAMLDRYTGTALAAWADALAGDPPARHYGPGRGLDSRTIVNACISYAEAVDRVPSVSELCLAVYISERRTRAAFNEEFDGLRPSTSGGSPLTTSVCTAHALDDPFRRPV